MKRFLLFTSFTLILFSFLAAGMGSGIVYVSTRTDNTITVWNYEEDFVEVLEFPGEEIIEKIEISQDGNMLYFISCVKEGNIYIKSDFVAYDLKGKEIIGRIGLGDFGVTRVSCMETNIPNNELWLSGQNAIEALSYLVVIDLIRLSVKHAISSDLVFQGIAFSKNHKKIYAAIYGPPDASYYENIVEVYSTENYMLLKSIEVGEPGSLPGMITEGKKGNLIVSNRLSGELAMIDPKTDEMILTKQGLIGSLFMAADISRNYLFVTSTNEEVIGVFDLETLDHITDIDAPGNISYFEHIVIDRQNKYLIHFANIYDSQNRVYNHQVEIINLDNFEIEKVLPMGEGRWWGWLSIQSND